MRTPTVSGYLKEFYNASYEGSSEWRRLGAIDKASNIVTVCANRKIADLLEVGAGEGSILHQLDQIGFAPSLYGLEISASGVAAIKQRGIKALREVQVFDGYRIPYPDKRFDLVCASHVLEHVEHDRLFLLELKRVGKAVFIEVPLDDTIWIERKIANDLGHINFYRRETLLNLLRTVGLNPIRWRTVNYSLAVAQYGENKIKAAVKHAIRLALLRAAPLLAERLFTYHFAVLAEPMGQRDG